MLVFFVENRMRKEHLSEAGEDSAKISVLKVAAWGKLAQTMANKLRKGTAVLVEGKLASLAFENRRREVRYNMEIYASAIQIIEVV